MRESVIKIIKISFRWWLSLEWLCVFLCHIGSGWTLHNCVPFGRLSLSQRKSHHNTLDLCGTLAEMHQTFFHQVSTLKCKCQRCVLWRAHSMCLISINISSSIDCTLIAFAAEFKGAFKRSQCSLSDDHTTQASSWSANMGYGISLALAAAVSALFGKSTQSEYCAMRSDLNFSVRQCWRSKTKTFQVAELRNVARALHVVHMTTKFKWNEKSAHKQQPATIWRKDAFQNNNDVFFCRKGENNSNLKLIARSQHNCWHCIAKALFCHSSQRACQRQ